MGGVGVRGQALEAGSRRAAARPSWPRGGGEWVAAGCSVGADATAQWEDTRAPVLLLWPHTCAQGRQCSRPLLASGEGMNREEGGRDLKSLLHENQHVFLLEQEVAWR